MYKEPNMRKEIKKHREPFRSILEQNTHDNLAIVGWVIFAVAALLNVIGRLLGWL